MAYKYCSYILYADYALFNVFILHMCMFSLFLCWMRALLNSKNNQNNQKHIWFHCTLNYQIDRHIKYIGRLEEDNQTAVFSGWEI